MVNLLNVKKPNKKNAKGKYDQNAEKKGETWWFTTTKNCWKKIILCSYHTHITQAYEKCLFLSSRLYVAHDSETLPEHKDERI